MNVVAMVGQSTPWLKSRWLAPAASVGLILLLLVTFARYVTLEHSDFYAYWSGVVAFGEGRPLYSDALTWVHTGYWLDDPRPLPTEGNPYVYPALLAIVLQPLRLFSAYTASLVWFTLSFLAAVGAGAVLAQVCVGKRLVTALAVGCGVVLFQPVRREMWLGQADMMILLPLMLSLLYFARRRDLPAALWLYFDLAVMPFLGFPVPFLLLKRGYRAAVVAVVTSGVLVVGPLLALGPSSVLDYLAIGSYWSGPQFAATFVNQSAYGVLLHTFTTLDGTPHLFDAPWLVLPLRAVIVLAMLAALAYSVSRSRDVDPALLAVEFGYAFVVMLVVTPLTEDIYFTYLVVFLLALVARGAMVRPFSRATLLPACGAIAIYLYFLWPLHTLLHQELPFFGLMATALLGVVAAWMQRRGATATVARTA
jgi:hypothetical protein